jgi:hypothetical protein
LRDPGGLPADVSVDAASRLVAIATQSSTSGGYPSVTFYNEGATQPCRTVVARDFTSISSAALDHSDNLYIVGALRRTAKLGIVRGGCRASKVSALTADNVLPAVAVRVSSQGRVLILSLQSDAEIDAYAIPAGNDLGKPIQRTRLQNPPNTEFIAFALSQDGNHMWMAPLLESFVFEYAYPDGGKPVASFATRYNGYNGIAVDPPNVP